MTIQERLKKYRTYIAGADQRVAIAKQEIKRTKEVNAKIDKIIQEVLDKDN